MSETAERLKTELASLPVEERWELADFLYKSLEGEIDDTNEAAFDAELERRFEELRSGKEVGIPFEQAMKQLREKYS
jgi:putative addiction module component (TIGR02574 family)